MYTTLYHIYTHFYYINYTIYIYIIATKLQYIPYMPKISHYIKCVVSSSDWFIVGTQKGL